VAIVASYQETFSLDDSGPEEAEITETPPLSHFYIGFDLEVGKSRLEELRRKVEAIGPVNLLALEELGELEDRLAFLLEQRADIEAAVADTVSVIAELKRRSRDRFTEAFYQINRNFSEMFQELFGGGHGEMRLIDETDVLESGIDIIAQPPGKRLQNVLLLSGGEKAMAALALVMGIFKYRPSPFCLLDEVDAPLDDVNIGRFSDKILEMSQHTQFMVITHSKRTMEAAKTLYGVTMEDPGVSKFISVRLT
jgi:chromosome segregation protein